MLGRALRICAFTFPSSVFCSSTWLLLATRLGWPVSTTYSIVSAIVGVGIAVGGWDAPNWGWENAKGLAAIWAGLFIAPALAAGFAAACYLLVKFLVLRNANPTRMGLIAGPFFFFVVAAVCTMSIVYVRLELLHSYTLCGIVADKKAVCRKAPPNFTSISSPKALSRRPLSALLLSLQLCLFSFGFPSCASASSRKITVRSIVTFACRPFLKADRVPLSQLCAGTTSSWAPCCGAALHLKTPTPSTPT